MTWTRRIPRLIPQSIAGRLTFWFLVIALVPCLALTALLYQLSSRSIAETVERNLGVIQTARASELEGFARVRIRDGEALSRAPMFSECAEQLAKIVAREGLDSAGYRNEAERFRDPLVSIVESIGYLEMLVFAPDGGLLLRSDGASTPGLTWQRGRSRTPPSPTWCLGPGRY